MTASAELAKLIRVTIVQDKRGVFVATSQDLKGLLAVSEDRVHLEKEIVPQSIADLYASCGVPVVISQLEESMSDEAIAPWVAVPAVVARKQLEAA